MPPYYCGFRNIFYICVLHCYYFCLQSAASAQVENEIHDTLQCFTNYTLVAECENIIYDEADLQLATFTYADGAMYEGYINTNEEHISQDVHVLSGRGTIHFKSGATYRGYFLNSERHGWGEHTYLDGSVYAGCWQRDHKHGRGSYTYGIQHAHPGAQYVGDWEEGQKHGLGEYFSDQLQYCGGFFRGKFQGKGQLLRHRDGAFYEGGFHNNHFSGYGKMTYRNGNTYKGEWLEGEKSGQGSFFDATSEVTYTGGWKADVMHGQGKMVFAADGFEMPGEWLAGSLVGEAGRGLPMHRKDEQHNMHQSIVK